MPSRSAASTSRPATAASALGLSTVYRCVALISTTVTQLRLVGRQGEAGWPLPGWMRRPAPWQLRDMHAFWVASLALSGGMAATVVRDPALGYRVAPVAPSRVAWRGGYPVPDATNVTWTLDGVDVPLLPAVEAQRIYGRTYLVTRPLIAMPGYPFGLGPIQAAAVGLGYALDVEKYGADLYGNPTPQGVLSTEQDITEDTAKRYRDRWIDEAAPIRVTGAGLTFSPLRLSPKDAAWLEARQFDAQAQARLMGVPARKLGLPSGDSVTYATARDNDQEYLRYTVMGYINPIEDTWSMLLPPGRGDFEDVRAELDTGEFINSWTADQPLAPGAVPAVMPPVLPPVGATP